MVTIPFFDFDIVPYKWGWRRVSGVTPARSLRSQSFCVPPCTTPCFTQQLLFSLFCLKNTRPTGKEDYEKRVGYSFLEMSLSTCLIFNRLPEEEKSKSTASLFLFFIHIASERVAAVGCPSCQIRKNK